MIVSELIKKLQVALLDVGDVWVLRYSEDWDDYLEIFSVECDRKPSTFLEPKPNRILLR